MLARASLFVAVPVLVVLAVCFVGGYRPICPVVLVVVVVLFAFVDFALTSQAILFRPDFFCHCLLFHLYLGKLPRHMCLFAVVLVARVVPALPAVQIVFLVLVVFVVVVPFVVLGVPGLFVTPFPLPGLYRPTSLSESVGMQFVS